MTSPALPAVTAETVSSIFERLIGMEIQLDPDPLQFGPKRLNGKIAEARGLLTQTERIFLQVSQDLQRLKTAKRQSETDFDIQVDDMLANDPEVRAGRNLDTQKAIAKTKLPDLRRRIADLDNRIQDLTAVMAVVKAKRSDLRDVQGRLKDQLRLCQEEIGLGNRWGSKPPPERAASAPDLDASPHVDQDSLTSLLDDIGGEIHVGPAPDPEPEEEPEPEVQPNPEMEADRCPVEGCGLVLFETESGAVCENGHGAESVLEDLLGDTPTPEPIESDLVVETKATPQETLASTLVPDPSVEEPAEAPEEMVVEQPKPDPVPAMQEASVPESEIDALLGEMDTPAAPTGGQSTTGPDTSKVAVQVVDADINLDDLIAGL